MNLLNRSLALSLCFTFPIACGDSGPSKGKTEVCDDCENPAGSSELFVGELSDELSEGGGPATVPLKLLRVPTAEVIVTAVSLDPDVVTVDPPEFAFTTENWSSTQRLTITPVDDKLDEEDQTAEIEFTVSSADPAFAGRTINPLVVTVADDDELPSVIVESEDGFDVPEDGTPITLSFTLSAQPDGDVLIPIGVSDDDQAELSAERLTFTTLDWNIEQEVVVTGIDDLDADGDVEFALEIGPTNSTDELFNDLPTQTVTLISVDGVCGNAVVDGAEACEPMGAPQMTCDYGVEDCTYCNDSCEEVAGASQGFCGDGIRQAQFEACDEPTRACPYGQMSCTTCNAQCEQVAGQVTGFCGDGTVQAAQEECDGTTCCTNCQKDTVCTADCLIFSQYVEGSQNDKAVEIYNCEGRELDLDGYVACLATNNNTTCNKYYRLSGRLAAGDVLTICNSSISNSSFCDVLEGNFTSFNGNDRMVLFLDQNGNDVPDGAEPIADAFGQTAVPPLDIPWGEQVFDRCDFDQYDGIGTFDLFGTFNQTLDCNSFCDYDQIFNGLGSPPVQSCP